jgi:PAS domain S-box-containing protein
MRLVVASMTDYAIVTFDLGGSIRSWNGGAERLFGFSAHEALGQSYGMLFSLDEQGRGAPQAELARAQATGRVDDERWHLRKDGSPVFCRGVLVALNDDAGPVGFAKISRDATRHAPGSADRDGSRELDRHGVARGEHQAHAHAHAGKHDAPAAAPLGLSGARILMVDDEVDILEPFEQILALAGAVVTTADSAERAAALARDNDYDVVISDIAMPGRDGYWLVEQLRGDPRTLGVPSVAVSGRAREADRRHALDSGFDAFIAKPLKLAALQLEIERLRNRGAKVHRPDDTH